MLFATLSFRYIKASSVAGRVIVIFGLAALLPWSVGAAVPAGSKVTFSATADGSPAPTFQWKRNGVNLPGATGAVFVISAVSLADAGTYRVTASNSAGAADSADEVLAVDVVSGVTIIAPTFSVQPVAVQTLATGGTAVFTAAATGTPTPTYQWLKQGVVMAGATSPTLTISNLSFDSAATYTIIATNSGGSVTSNPSVLNVTAPVVTTPPPSPNVAPSITTQPISSQSVVSGATVTWTVVAVGTPAPSYQWKKNGNVISGATNSILTLAGVTSSDSATYTVVATNTGGSVTSSPAVLTVTSAPVSTPPPVPPQNVAPAITTQPVSSQNSVTGGVVTLTVAATGTPTPTYQWLKNDVPVAGATNTALSLTGAAQSDSGTYVVVVSNIAGSVSSSPALVTVSAPVVSNPPPISQVPLPPPSNPSSVTPVAPSIGTQPVANQSVLAGGEATFTVAVSANPAPTFQWRKNGNSIVGATGSTLVLRNTTAIDAATYSVVVANSAGSVTSANSVLTVNLKPSFVAQPANQAINLGARVIFNVVAVGIPSPSLQWFKNGNIMPGSTGSTLVLNVTSAADVATYRVTATNSFGSATSQDAALVVAAPPIITSQPLSQTVTAKSNVSFSVGATGGPAPTYQWKKDGTKISGATNSTLSLTSVGQNDAGDYSVEVSNSVGWLVSFKAALKVIASNERRQRDTDDESGAIEPGIAALATSRIVNLSVRSRAGSGNNGLIVGFVVGGSSTKPMLLRGVGPALTEFGVSDALLDPTLALYAGAAMTASNDDWAQDVDAAQIVGTSARLGAFSLRESSADSALMANLETGAYTVQVNGKAAATGVALVEVYDAATSNSATLVNLSVRTQVGTGADAPNVGFVVSGTTAKRVMIRAVGPTLAAFGVSDVLADPQLEIFKEGVRLDGNDNWGGDSALSATFARIGAFGLAQAESKDAVLLMTLEPGAYTVVASGVNGGTGVALVEVYDVP